MMILRRKKRYSVKKVKKKFLLFPILYKGSFFWLSKVEIEKSFNGITMQIINIKKANN